MSAGRSPRCPTAGGVLERAVAAVAEQAVAVGERSCRRRERPALDDIDVEPAVAVVVEQADAAAHRLGELSRRSGPVVEDEPQPSSLRVVAEGWGWPSVVQRLARGGRAGLLQIGEQATQGVGLGQKGGGRRR